MNRFILNYINNDKTGRAILLTGGWGSGKSYYILHKLKPFLEEKANGKHKCIIVSLYGLTSVTEISKAIYTELRSFRFKKKHEGLITAGVAFSVLPKTVFNALTSHAGFDIGQVSDKQLQKVYESIDLTKKLLVLEDIERTRIDIEELLGYINNMCECDGVKVLLVANEKELLQYHYEQKKINDHGKEKIVNQKVYSERGQKYLKAKEKTVSDTIRFFEDSKETVLSIIKGFHHDELIKYADCIDVTQTTMQGKKRVITNYREFIVACQKTCDLFDYLKENQIHTDDEFKKCIFIGMVYYLQLRLKNDELRFKDNSMFDSSLSENIQYPLIRFCYDYYHYQEINEQKVRTAIDQYPDYVVAKKPEEQNDPDLKILEYWYLQSEADVKQAIDNICNRLDNVSDISIYSYFGIIASIINLKYETHLAIDKQNTIIAKIMRNLKGRGPQLGIIQKLVTPRIGIIDADGKKEFEEIVEATTKLMLYAPPLPTPSSSMNLSEMISEIDKGDIERYHPDDVLSAISLDRITDNIADITPYALADLDDIFRQIDYSLVSAEKKAEIQSFLSTIKKDLEKEHLQVDHIQKWRIGLICNTITEKLQSEDNDANSNDSNIQTH